MQEFAAGSVGESSLRQDLAAGEQESHTWGTQTFWACCLLTGGDTPLDQMSASQKQTKGHGTVGKVQRKCDTADFCEELEDQRQHSAAGVCGGHDRSTGVRRGKG